MLSWTGSIFLFCYQSEILSLFICRDESANKGLRKASSAKPAPESPETKHRHRFAVAAAAAVRSHAVHAGLHIYIAAISATLALSSRHRADIIFSTPRYREAAKKMIDPESWRHTAAVYSSRFKIIACFPPPIFCLSTAIISAILAAPYSADGSHCLLLLRSPQTGFKAVLLVNNKI